MMKRLAAAVVAVLLGISGLAAAQGRQQDLVQILQSGALTDRYQAARDALQIPPQQRGEALWVALQILLEGSSTGPYNIPPTPLSPAAKRILQLARDLLLARPGDVWRDLPTEAGLALATGDEDLRQQVESLAREPGLVAQFTGEGDANEIARIQRAIRARLDRHKRR